ncbi:hypothetical protein L596_009909 [Steinernema carpocapsae]|uniref:Cytosolic fatty-acid binding proteins domain-containing protein n=1 Tax=Steinernema carpocapsae TaxID=34508 RepID=A0A4V6A6T2_STECR|nr:hypothetical protein L596_009909 [Steinernema carpocapsae]
MCENFIGKWKLVDSENFESYLKEIGVGMMTREMLENTKLLLEVSIDGDKVKMQSTTPVKSHTMEFKLDEETEYDTIDGRKMKAAFEIVDGKLLQHEEPTTSGYTTSSDIIRWIEDDKLIVKLESHGVISKRIYEKQ